MKIRLNSDGARMSNRQYHKAGQPHWWARIGSGDSASFLRLPRVRGDEALDEETDAPDGTKEVVFGVGGREHGIRCTWHPPTPPQDARRGLHIAEE